MNQATTHSRRIVKRNLASNIHNTHTLLDTRQQNINTLTIVLQHTHMDVLYSVYVFIRVVHKFYWQFRYFGAISFLFYLLASLSPHLPSLFSLFLSISR